MSGNLAVSTINGVDISVSPVATESKVIGVGQTWQNVTGSRAFGTTYTNSTGKPILVQFHGSGSGANVVYCVIAGNFGQLSCGGTTTFQSGLSFVVGVGDTYSISMSGPATLTYWRELR